MRLTKERLDTVVSVFVILAALSVTASSALVVWRVGMPSLASRRATPPAVEDLTSQPVLDLEAERIPHTNVVLVEFSDFECPFCGSYARDTFPTLNKTFVESGKLGYVFLNLPLQNHPNAEKAAEAGECARAQNRFWEMHDQLFHNQRNLTVPDLLRYAASIGLEPAAFGRCMDGQVSAIVAEHTDRAKSLGVTSTPAFFVGVRQANGTVVLLKTIRGAQPFEVFRGAVEDVLQTVARR